VRVNRADLRGQRWPGAAADEQAHGEQRRRARRDYLRAVSQGAVDRLGPVTRALCEPALLRLHRRSRTPLGATFVPGANCRPGRHKLHVSVDGAFQPCEKTGAVMGIGDVESGIGAAAVERIRDRFHRAVQDRCGDCWALRLCGVCFANQARFAAPERGAFPVPETVCRAVRREREETLGLLVRILRLPGAQRSFLDRRAP
jgi:radical SAM protein with 4Fe4S-binding SPASM domain